MRVTFLGTGTSVGVPAIGCRCPVCSSRDPLDRRLRTSALVAAGGRNILIDASIDLRQQMLREGVDRLDAVLLTHGHADHVFGLDDLRMFNYRQQQPIPIHGSPATLADLRRTFWYVFQEPPDASSRPQLDLIPVEGPFDCAGVSVESFRVLHGSMPILGYRVGGFGYITDGSSLPEETIAALRGLDLLVINALRRKPHPTHFTLDEALRAIERIRPRRALLTHISHDFGHAELAGELPPGVEPAYDGLRVDLEMPPDPGAAP
ncbi:MAG TPA: MBL fold metallo-hydrolase [Candidatus Polarisedimenticolia bacterium]|nr:MBL fold metallo-hydrolase [Candidatus Polarisedimenticolia bacterium]